MTTFCSVCIRKRNLRKIDSDTRSLDFTAELRLLLRPKQLHASPVLNVRQSKCTSTWHSEVCRGKFAQPVYAFTTISSLLIIDFLKLSSSRKLSRLVGLRFNTFQPIGCAVAAASWVICVPCLQDMGQNMAQNGLNLVYFVCVLREPGGLCYSWGWWMVSCARAGWCGNDGPP